MGSNDVVYENLGMLSRAFLASVVAPPDITSRDSNIKNTNYPSIMSQVLFYLIYTYIYLSCIPYLISSAYLSQPIYQVTMQYGDEGRPFGISSLLDEMDFRDQRPGPAAQKVSIYPTRSLSLLLFLYSALSYPLPGRRVKGRSATRAKAA